MSEIEVSLLSPLQRILPEEIEIGKHGLLVEQGRQRGDYCCRKWPWNTIWTASDFWKKPARKRGWRGTPGRTRKRRSMDLRARSFGRRTSKVTPERKSPRQEAARAPDKRRPGRLLDFDVIAGVGFDAWCR